MKRRIAFVLGHEEWGHSFSREDYPDISSVSIPQFGQVESLNVSVATGVVLFEALRQRSVN